MMTTIQIDQFHLRVPGLTSDEAHQLADETARRLAGRLPDRVTAQDLGVLDLHLTVPWGTPRSRVADLIVEAILKQLA
jgi:hypothetical protein